MRIANPIYDVVFKYLLDDERVARILLSALLGRDVLDLKYRATEVRSEIGPSVLVLRLDFAATVKFEDGESRLILVEIQKAHSAMDVVRFRRYLGAEYASTENLFVDSQGRSQALPIITVYFLGEGLDHTEAPVVRVNRLYRDATTNEPIPTPEPFVEALTHDSVIVQINRLKDRRRTELERLLMVFDQGLRESGDPHFLDIIEGDYPLRYQEVLRRLLRAHSEKGVRDGMDVEDEYLSTLLDKDRLLAEQDKVLEEKQNVIGEQGKALEEKQNVIGEQGKALEEKQNVIGEQGKALEELRKAMEGQARLLQGPEEPPDRKDEPDAR